MSLSFVKPESGADGNHYFLFTHYAPLRLAEWIIDDTALVDLTDPGQINGY